MGGERRVSAPDGVSWTKEHPVISMHSRRLDAGVKENISVLKENRSLCSYSMQRL